jgi:hypothetical protein
MGRYERRRHLLSAAVVAQRVATLNHIIGGLTKTLNSVERKRAMSDE